MHVRRTLAIGISLAAFATAAAWAAAAPSSPNLFARYGVHSRPMIPAPADVQAMPAITGWYPVLRVVDGDTVVLAIDGASTTVRLIGLDTPEVVDPRKPVMCFGAEASEEAKKLLTGKTVGLAPDPSQSAYDKYGRLLAYLFLPDGTNVSQFMIAQGYGHEYTYRTPYAYQVQFKAAQQDAQAAGRGLWAPGACPGQ